MNRSRFPSRATAGFTLLEIMLVVAIIMILLSLAVYKLGPQLNVAKGAAAQADIRSIGAALMGYESQGGFLPSTEQGLNALLEKPAIEPHPRRWMKQMDSLQKDPWGQPYNYKEPGKHNPSSYDLYSSGPDHQPDTDDDIGNWE